MPKRPRGGDSPGEIAGTEIADFTKKKNDLVIEW
jgi:hypothetical protein